MFVPLWERRKILKRAREVQRTRAEKQKKLGLKFSPLE
jgi:hypothetical protein